MSTPTGLLPSVYFGDMMNIMLFGCILVQFSNYLVHFYERDVLLVKSVVILLVVLEACQTGLLLYDGSVMFCSRWGDDSVLSGVQTRWLAIPVIGSINSFIVEMFYAWRIWKFTQKWILFVVIAVVALVPLICGTVIGFMVGVGNLNFNKSLIQKTLTLTIVWLTGSAIADILIATILIIILVRSRKRVQDSANSRLGDGPQTAHLLTRVIYLNLGTGFLSALFSTASLISVLIVPHAAWHMIPASVVSKLCGCCLFVVLNCRTGGIPRMAPSWEPGRSSSPEFSRSLREDSGFWGVANTLNSRNTFVLRSTSAPMDGASSESSHTKISSRPVDNDLVHP